MALVRSALLAASQSPWLRKRAPRLPFVRRTVSRFMPGETAEDALSAAQQLQAQGIATVFTELGENITDTSEAARVTEHYIALLDQIRARGLPSEVSVKLTQLGVDISSAQCYGNLKRIIQHAGERSTVWIDMEASPYVDITLELYRRARTAFPNVGVCLQAYLHRTAQDIAALMPLSPAIRLVKGAYKEPLSVAYARKEEVDESYFALTRRLLGEPARRAGVRTAIATHDCNLIRRITSFADTAGLARDQYEFQMLYGIQRAELNRLVQEGYRARILIAYGTYWFPWFVRRLAERPANVWFVVRNLFAA
ncbi:MAG TPA: proline dehydrogenase family protein [Bryobacteraceae bacterium]|nr:proline dehydrogenase family protein [Bryobacteraceae bacterium]